MNRQLTLDIEAAYDVKAFVREQLAGFWTRQRLRNLQRERRNYLTRRRKRVKAFEARGEQG
jgi:hypothetical protein